MIITPSTAGCWQREIMYGIFTEKDWEEFVFMFDESDFEVYET